MNIKPKYEAEIDELANRWLAFGFLRHADVPKENMNKYGTFISTLYGLQTIFIGKTGYGKSTTLNRLIGRDVFDVNDINACTKKMHSAMYHINEGDGLLYDGKFFVLCDLPGVGESGTADPQYRDWYKGMIAKSHCVVYVLRADQRDYAIDELIFREMLSRPADKAKVVLALNFADKAEPINRAGRGLSAEQRANLNCKCDIVAGFFKVPREDVLYYSAAETLNLNPLTERIAAKVKRAL